MIHLTHWPDFGLHGAELLSLVNRARAGCYSPGVRIIGGLEMMASFASRTIREALNFMRVEFDEFAPEPPGRPRITCGALRMAPGSSVPRHNHAAAAEFVAVMYLSDGSPLIFPNLGRQITPEPGRVVIFRGDEWHSVARHDGHLERVSMNFNRKRVNGRTSR